MEGPMIARKRNVEKTDLRRGQAPIDTAQEANVNAAVHDVDERQEEAKGGHEMGKQEMEYRRLSREELEKLAGEPLPERAAMSLINANVAAPVNVPIALNVLSDDSVAYANAEQNAYMTQDK
jgi:hypothetical protein